MAEEKKSTSPFYKKREFIFAAAFVALVVFLLFSSRIAGRPPVLDSITPRIGYPKDVMVITGRFFGKNREGGEVVIGGYPLVSSDYLEWNDNQISLRIPDDVASGLVRVLTKKGKSRGILFTNREQIPVVLSGPEKPGEPYIRAVDPQAGSVGALLTLTGMNFGVDRGAGRVLFTWVSSEGVAQDSQGEGGEGASLTPALDYDQDYEDWGDREIQVRIPDGASSGHLVVATDKGRSNAVYIEVGGAAGTKLFPLKRTYALQYSIEVRVTSATEPNSLYLWIPKPLEAPEQRGIQLVAQEPEPMFDELRGVKLFRLENLVAGGSYQLTQSYMVERYSIETRVNIGRVSLEYDTSTKLYKRYTTADPLVPAGNERIVKQASAIVGGERNPYRKARAIYEWMLNRLEPSAAGVERDPLRLLDTRKGEAYDYAMLFCALTRSAGLPARPVAGYLLDRDQKATRHYWAEFYIPHIGWIPVDPYLGEGKARTTLPADANPRVYYFGNLDYSHLTFSKGLIELSAMDPMGRAVRRADIPSLQGIHEEASGNLSSYSAYWSDIQITGVY
jgi:hypothetical protein